MHEPIFTLTGNIWQFLNSVLSVVKLDGVRGPESGDGHEIIMRMELYVRCAVWKTQLVGITQLP